MGAIQFLFSVNAGIRDYSIFLDRPPVPSLRYKSGRKTTPPHLAGLAGMQRWWLYMADLMETSYK